MSRDVSEATGAHRPAEGHPDGGESPGPEPAADDVDPRVQRTRRAVQDAGRELLLDSGPDTITHAAVATAAGLSRTTLYRYWPTRAELLLDICQASAPRRAVAPSGDVRRDVIDVAIESGAVLADPDTRKTFAQMLAQAQWDDEAREVLSTLTAAGLADLTEILSAGQEAGTLRPGIDPLVVAGRLLGPLMFASLIGETELDVAAIESIVDDWLASARA